MAGYAIRYPKSTDEGHATNEAIIIINIIINIKYYIINNKINLSGLSSILIMKNFFVVLVGLAQINSSQQ